MSAAKLKQLLEIYKQPQPGVRLYKAQEAAEAADKAYRAALILKSDYERITEKSVDSKALYSMIRAALPKLEEAQRLTAQIYAKVKHGRF